MRVHYRKSPYQHFMNCEYWKMFIFFFFFGWSAANLDHREHTSRKLFACNACSSDGSFHSMCAAHLAFLACLFRKQNALFPAPQNGPSVLSRSGPKAARSKRLWASHRFINKCNPRMRSAGRWTYSRVHFGRTDACGVCLALRSPTFGRIVGFMTLFRSCNARKPQIFQMLSILNLIKFKFFAPFLVDYCLNRAFCLFCVVVCAVGDERAKYWFLLPRKNHKFQWFRNWPATCILRRFCAWTAPKIGNTLFTYANNGWA